MKVDGDKYKVTKKGLPLSMGLLGVSIILVVVFGWTSWTGIILAIFGGMGLGHLYHLFYNCIVGGGKKGRKEDEGC